MKKEKLRPILRDIDFLDKDTLQKVCSYNQCYKKFEVNTEEQTYFSESKNSEVVSESQFHECTECGRRYSTKNDTRITWGNRHEANYQKSIEMYGESTLGVEVDK